MGLEDYRKPKPLPTKRATAPKGKPKAGNKPHAKVDSPDPSEYANAKKGALPDFVEPQLATLVDVAPDGNNWFHEIN
jgi:bifunctional non-homologous end joining protein LigD